MKKNSHDTIVLVIILLVFSAFLFTSVVVSNAKNKFCKEHGFTKQNFDSKCITDTTQSSSEVICYGFFGNKRCEWDEGKKIIGKKIIEVHN